MPGLSLRNTLGWTASWACCVCPQNLILLKLMNVNITSEFDNCDSKIHLHHVKQVDGHEIRKTFGNVYKYILNSERIKNWRVFFTFRQYSLKARKPHRILRHQTVGFIESVYEQQWLTHICLMDYSILISWTSPFPILGAPGVIFYFYFILDSNFWNQTVQNLIRGRVLRRLIWIYTVCLGPQKGTLC